jgi:hypothetical protein
MKKGLIQDCLYQLEDKLRTYKNEFRLIQGSSSEESKSSMGDKYETGPELLNAEKEKLAGAIEDLNKLRLTLASIKVDQEHEIAEFGSIVSTDQGLFFLSAPMGPIEYKGNQIFLISMLSPLGQAFLGRKKGEKFVFRESSYEILSLE